MALSHTSDRCHTVSLSGTNRLDVPPMQSGLACQLGQGSP